MDQFFNSGQSYIVFTSAYFVSSPIFIHRKLHLSTAFLSVVLMLSLLLTQWLGYSHAIAHAGSPNKTIGFFKTNAGSVEHQKTSSACISFDAATLVSGLHTTQILFAVAPAFSCPPLAVLDTGHEPAFFVHFSSRAPPLIFD
jgi:hypothetical protein